MVTMVTMMACCCAVVGDNETTSSNGGESDGKYGLTTPDNLFHNKFHCTRKSVRCVNGDAVPAMNVALVVAVTENLVV